jgi:small-conductance mechanosensitive channel
MHPKLPEIKSGRCRSQYLITHEYTKRLHRRYRDEGIEIPFPMRTVEIRGGAGVASPG